MVKLVTTMNEDLKAAFGDLQDEEEDEDKDEDVEVDGDEETFDLHKVIPPNIEHMRCAAHTLQLAVYDGNKNSKARVETKIFIFIFDKQCSFFVFSRKLQIQTQIFSQKHFWK